MLKMFRKNKRNPVSNQDGAGLIMAVFVVVVMGMFGLLISRFSSVGALSSSEDYFWAQALYSAQSAAQVHILYNDGGGTGTRNLVQVAGLDVETTPIIDGVQAKAAKNIADRPVERTIEIHLDL